MTNLFRNLREFYRKFSSRIFPLGLFLLLAFSVWAQTAPPQTAPAPQPQAEPSAKEQKISPAEAEELFHSVDEIMRFASKDTGLPIKQEVKRRLASRDEVTAYVEKNMAKDEDAQRLRRSELVLKKFGLVPRDFDLQTFLLGLWREQVAGYYDPETKTVSLLDWVGAEQQKPVMAHELTHALQDQSFGLKKWLKGNDLNDKKTPTPADIENDEITAARQAVVEGQAMLTLIDYELAPTHQTLAGSPQLLGPLKQEMVNGTADSTLFRQAPIFLRESLIFPYRYGMEFALALQQAGGPENPFARPFRQPPVSTRNIMQPETYLSGEKIPPMPVPDFNKIFPDYERFDIGAIGQFDVDVLVHQYAGEAAAREISPHWRGGYYYAARPKKDTAAPLGILYLSRWSNAERATQFAALYVRSLPQRYKQVQEELTPGDVPLRLPALLSLNGKHIWTTEEGPVVVTVKNDMVLVTESLDGAISNALEKALLSPQP